MLDAVLAAETADGGDLAAERLRQQGLRRLVHRLDRLLELGGELADQPFDRGLDQVEHLGVVR
jgi:hypothetical protein